MSIADVRHYLDNGFDKVSGWCIPQLWQVIQPIAEWQESQGLHQPIAEIGVFHGKFFIGLMKTKSVANNVAIDVFSLQQFNRDGAGEGNLATFQANIVANGGRLEDVSCHERDSMSLTARDVEAFRDVSGGGFSMFSVDGCHTVEHTMNDALIAMELTVPGGLIFIDDYNNPHWPGVQEGMFKLYHFSSPRWLPLALSANKMLLTHISFHDQHLALLRDHLRTNFPETRVKDVERFGYKNLTVIPNMASGKSLTDA